MRKHRELSCVPMSGCRGRCPLARNVRVGSRFSNPCTPVIRWCCCAGSPWAAASVTARCRIVSVGVYSREGACHEDDGRLQPVVAAGCARCPGGSRGAEATLRALPGVQPVRRHAVSGSGGSRSAPVATGRGLPVEPPQPGQPESLAGLVPAYPGAGAGVAGPLAADTGGGFRRAASRLAQLLQPADCELSLRLIGPARTERLARPHPLSVLAWRDLGGPGHWQCRLAATVQPRTRG